MAAERVEIECFGEEEEKMVKKEELEEKIKKEEAEKAVEEERNKEEEAEVKNKETEVEKKNKEEEEEENEMEREREVVKAEIEREQEHLEEVLILPEGYSEARIAIHLTAVIKGMTGEPAVRHLALAKLHRVLSEVQDEPTALLPTGVLGHLVALTCLCALESSCSQKAAEILRQLFPLLWRRENELRRTPGGLDVIERALAVTGPSLNAHHLARVFGAFLPAPQLLEAIQVLAELPDAFNCLDGLALLQELLEQFLEKTLRIQDVLERLCLQAGPAAFLILQVLAKSHLKEIVEAFLHFRFSDYQEQWGVLLSSAQQTELFLLLAAWMPNMAGQGKCAGQVLQHFMRSAGTASKKVLKALFPQLSLALLGQLYICGSKHQELTELAQANVNNLLRAVGIRRGDLKWNSFWGGLSAFASLLIKKGAWTIPGMAAHVQNNLGDNNPAVVPEVAIAMYIELFVHRRCVQPNTVDHLCRWLGHGNPWVRRVSLRGLAVLLWGEMSRWTKQMAVLRALRYAADGDTTLNLMDLVETILPALQGGEETFSRVLANIYIDHMAHKDERVRAAAIYHLCRLRSELPGPQLMGDALSEFVHILLHVDEEEVVATAAKAALTQLLPGVNWKVAPEQFNVHHLLDQAARYVTKRYNPNNIRQAALLCTLLPPDTLPAVSRVAALFVAYLTHRKPSCMSGDDMYSLCSWLQEMGSSDENVELRIAAKISAEAVNHAYLDYENRGCFGRCRRRQRHPHGFPH